MPGKIGAMVAAVAAAASALGAASWAKRRKDANSEPELEVAEGAEAAEVGDAPEPASYGGGAAAPAAPAGEVSAETGHDDLTAIKGLGKVKAAKLVDTGVTSYAQIAAWSDDDIAEVGLRVNTSSGQIKREDWVGQAKALAQG